MTQPERTKLLKQISEDAIDLAADTDEAMELNASGEITSEVEPKMWEKLRAGVKKIEGQIPAAPGA